MNTDHIFAGLKVVDLASFLAGPGAATVLSDFGADVIKVEPPGIGDLHRIMYKVPPLPSAKENFAWQLWHEVFERARVTYGIVKTAAEVTTAPQTLANDIIVPIEGGSGHLTRTVSSPIRIHGVPKSAARRAPELGEHNDQILKELGFTDKEIDGFRAGGSVPQPAEQVVAGGVR